MVQQPSAVELALLVERMSRLITAAEGMSESIAAIHKRLDEMPVMKRDIELLSEQTNRLFIAQSAIKEAMNKQVNVVSSHSLIWKICSTVASGCAVAIVGFGYNTLQTLHGQEAILDRRIAIVEFQLKGMPYVTKVKD